MTVKLVDPPSGWMYGFPAVLEDDYEAQLRKAGYPDKDIELSMKHSRFIYIEDEENDS
jgi:hypothetical protein